MRTSSVSESITQRLVHLTDETRRHELMVIYAENLALLGFTAADLNKGGTAYDQWPKVSSALLERAKAALSLTK